MRYNYIAAASRAASDAASAQDMSIDIQQLCGAVNEFVQVIYAAQGLQIGHWTTEHVRQSARLESSTSPFFC